MYSKVSYPLSVSVNFPVVQQYDNMSGASPKKAQTLIKGIFIDKIERYNKNSKNPEFWIQRTSHIHIVLKKHGDSYTLQMTCTQLTFGVLKCQSS